MWMIVSLRSVVFWWLILGRTKDRTGENHASAFSPLKIRPESQEQASILVQRELTIFVACGRTSFKLPSLARISVTHVVTRDETRLFRDTHTDRGRARPRSVPRPLYHTSSSYASNNMSIVTIRVCVHGISLSSLDSSTPFQNVEFLNNPARFLDPYHFRVTFECIAALKEGALPRIDQNSS
jgi:hypothetical protein